MANRRRSKLEHRALELGGVQYVVLRESDFQRLCRKAGMVQAKNGGAGPKLACGELELDRATLSEKLIRRRRAAGLSQVDLAIRAGIRPETLNRIERGRTTPDFATVRKLVVAMNAAELERATV